jgi:hypothetical protein
VTYRLCHRCHAELPPHDEGTLIFCSNCGAPLVVLSEELQTQAEAQTGPDGAAAPPAPRDSRSLVWAGAIRCAALAGAITAGTMLLSLLLPQVVLLTIFWVVISPVVVIGIFQARYPLAPITSGFGARLGLLTGLANGLVLSVSTTISFYVARRLGSMAEFDKQWDLGLKQVQERMGSQSAADVAALLKMYSLPEFRAGMMLASAAFGLVLLLAITIVGGAFAGFARSRARA